MNSKSNLAFIGFLGAMMMSTTTESRTPNREVLSKLNLEPKKIIPKGCKEYWFTKTGSIYTSKPENYEAVFQCIASSEKVAHKKFDKWHSENNL